MKRTRRRGEGTIDQHGDRWRVRLRMPDGSRKALVTEPGASYEEAEGLRAAALLQLAGTMHDPRAGGMSLAAWGVQWLDAREQTHRDAAGDRQRWNQHVAPAAIGRVRLDALSPDHVARWLAERAALAVGRGTVRNVYTTLRAALRASQMAGLISAPRLRDLLSVPMPTMRIEQTVEMDERIEWLRDEEIGAVLALDLPPDAGSAFVVGAWTGLRAGELHGLDWSRVRLTDRAPHVVVARSRDGATKAGRVASVPLLEPARRALDARWQKAGRPTSGLVWPADGGGPHARGFDWGWADHVEMVRGERRVRRGIRSRAGIARPVTWNDATRHTCAVHLLRGSWAPDFVPAPYRLEEVSRFLRHSSIKVTERHYASLALDALPVVLPAVDPEDGSNGSSGDDFLSHTGDLNSGPTVYETVAQASDSEGLPPSWAHAGPTGARLRGLAARVLRHVALRDAAGLVEPASDLAVAIIEAERLEVRRESVSLRAVRGFLTRAA